MASFAPVIMVEKTRVGCVRSPLSPVYCARFTKTKTSVCLQRLPPVTDTHSSIFCTPVNVIENTTILLYDNGRTHRPILSGSAHARVHCDLASDDIDSLDAAFVPGTGWPEPGGLLPREAHKLVGGVAKEGLCGMELVEVRVKHVFCLKWNVTTCFVICRQV